MNNKKIYDVHLYENGVFEVKESRDDKMLVNDILFCCHNRKRSISKQSYEEDINKVKEYLVTYKLRECKKELKELENEIKIYEKAKNSI